MAFALLETMRLEGGRAVRLEQHLARMAASARYFGYHWDDRAVHAAVAAEADAHKSGCWRLRLLVSPEGTPTAECTSHLASNPRVWRVAFAEAPVDDRDPFLFNKTTNRATYDSARRAHPDVDDVLLWNGRGEVTEATIANLVVDVEGVRCTPPVDCGLLPGIFRAHLIEAGAIEERVLLKADVVRAPRLWLINSLREWIDAVLI